MSYDVFDHVATRCPMLGGEVTFAYCRTLQDGLPCPRALVCFEHKFPVDQFFARILQAETFKRCFAGPREGRYQALLRVFFEANEER